jgi:hypothetical protein
VNAGCGNGRAKSELEIVDFQLPIWHDTRVERRGMKLCYANAHEFIMDIPLWALDENQKFGEQGWEAGNQPTR